MPAGERMTGVYPILVTPFDERGRIDEESLRSLIDFNLEAGVHGLGIAMASEVLKLTEAERDQLTRLVVEQVRGRVPVVVNTGGPATDVAVYYSRRARDLGADALMCQPPTLSPPTATETRSYFKAISGAVSIPIFIQDTATAHVPAGLARQIAEESEHVRYTKVESLPPAQMVGANVRVAGDLLTVFGGAGASYLIEEIQRGAQGTMPWPSTPRELVEIWNRARAGDLAGAEEIFYRVLVPINRVSVGGMRGALQVQKEILRRKGIIKTAHVRAPADPLDPETAADLDRLCVRLGIGDGS
ncbi:MAG TPA: dihydrodipicolinate synthase family protein [Chloroflexota bacterium]|nr:dihydrodipicolinate synthase family protein [Chloroflexota bacterium]